MKYTKQTLTKPVLMMTMALSLLVGFASPTTAQTQEVLPFMTSTVQDFLVDDEPRPTFPQSGARAKRYGMWVVATSYSSDPYQTDSTPCIPADGFDLCGYYEETGDENVIAANFLPLGTHVRFPDLYGDKVFIVRDRMNKRYNGTNRIDFWIGSGYPETQEIIQEAKTKARKFGVQSLRMEIL